MLYQIDVGKLPLAELWEGALAQARLPVENAIQQTARECQTEIRDMVRAWDAAGGAVPRTTKLAAQGMVAAVRRFADDVSEAMKCSLAPSPVADVNGAFGMVSTAAEKAELELLRLSQRDRLEAERLGALAQAAGKQVKALAAAFEHALPPCYEVTTFAVKLVKGVRDRTEEIDGVLAAVSPGWSQERQVAVDRNILRIAVFEMRFLPDVPTGASINEAVELAKKYSTAESGRFVNGVLGALVAAPAPAKG